MKFRALLTAAAVMLLVASAATAAPPPGKGKPATAGNQPCKANVSVVLTGTLAADYTAPSISVNVTGGNKFGKLFKSTTAASVTIAATTKIVKGADGAKAQASSLKSGDKVNVQAKACKASLSASTLPTLTATRVTVQGTGSDSSGG